MFVGIIGNMDEKQQFGQNLKRFRKAAGMTQEALAVALATSRTNITRWEQGERIPDMDMLHHIVDYFGISLEELYVFRDPKAEKPAGYAPTVLVLEDEEAPLKKAMQLIRNELKDSKILGFKNAKDALYAIRDTEIRIAFLDVCLPGMNGIEFAKELLLMYPKVNLIFLTSHNEYMADALALYASGYVTKPLTETKLKRELENLRHP